MKNSFNTEKLLEEKEIIHGSFDDNAELLEQFMMLMEAAPNYKRLTAMHKYCLRMIFLKICRMLCGDIFELDTPKDISGYATGLYQHLSMKGRYYHNQVERETYIAKKKFADALPELQRKKD